jgi:glutathione synthase/RimK-type ligase-like ATP-grasp enzyme
MSKQSILAIGLNISVEETIQIQKKIKKKNVTLDVASIKDLFLEIVDGKTKVLISDKNFEDYDYVWIQSGWNTTHMAYLLHLYLKSKKIPHNKTNIHNTKLSDILSLSLKGVFVPNTFFHNGLQIDDDNILKIEKICKFPCIYKTLLGSLGAQVYLIEKKSDIEGTIRENGRYNRYIFQEYISNDFDYRVVVANGKPISVCKRTRVDDGYRNNVALGAKEEFFKIEEVSKSVLDIAIESAKALKLNWAGVDVVTDKNTGKDYVLEVNRRPGLTENSSEMVAAYKYILNLVGN